jgi:hypothetical protein
MRKIVLARVTKADIRPLLIEWKKQGLNKAKATAELKRWLKANNGPFNGVFETVIEEVYAKPVKLLDATMPKAIEEGLPKPIKTTPAKLSPKLLASVLAKVEEIRNKSREHVYFFDLETGKIIAYATSGTNKSVSLDPASAKTIEKYGSTRLATLHNHPNKIKKGYDPCSFSYLHGKDMIYLHQFPLNIVCSPQSISWVFSTSPENLKAYGENLSGVNALMGSGTDEIETYIWNEIHKLENLKVLAPKYYKKYWIPTVNVLAHNWWAKNAKRLKVTYWRT